MKLKKKRKKYEKIFLGVEELVREGWGLTTMSAGSSSFPPIASHGFTALCFLTPTWTIRTMNTR